MPLVPMGPKDDPYKMFQSRPDQLPGWVSYDPSADGAITMSRVDGPSGKITA